MLQRKITAVVPIKLNNERVPGKNTKILGGRPMISYILQALLDCKRCDEIYVYCSQESIIPYLPDGVKFKKMKNTHTGERCFIIGNGPSLKAQDLELLRNEYCFAANRIYEIFPDTSWRPSCYLCADSHIFRECMGFIAGLELPIILLHAEVRKYHMEYRNSSITYINNFYPFFVNRYKYIHGIKVSPNVSHYFICGETVTFLSIQLALYMGFKEIYLLGVDHNYSRKLTSTGQMIIDPSIKDYFGDLQSQDYNIQNIDTSTAAYQAALEYCQKNNVTIKNATHGGKLEVFPRISFDSLVTDC